MSIESASPLAISSFGTIAVGLMVLLFGYYQARSKNFKNHRSLMLVAAAVNAAFLIQYIVRFSLGQETHFTGPEIVKNFVYLPILVIHITLAIATVGLVIIHLKRSLSHEQWTNRNVPYFDKEYRGNHRSFGKITFILWAISYVGGITIFLFLYILF